MSSWSDSQVSTVMESGWLGVRTVERDLPPKMLEIGDSTKLAYIRVHRQARFKLQSEKEY